MAKDPERPDPDGLGNPDFPPPPADAPDQPPGPETHSGPGAGGVPDAE